MSPLPMDLGARVTLQRQIGVDYRLPKISENSGERKMKTVVLQVETELDPSAAPRVFGYLGGLGHIPLQAALRRDGNDNLVIEVQFDSQLAAAQLISAKVGQMPFVLTANLCSAESSGGASATGEVGGGADRSFSVTGGMQHAPTHRTAQHHRLDVAAMRMTAAQRGRAIHHRSWVHLNA